MLDWWFKDTCGTFQPYVVPLFPFSLWGRDVLSQMGVLLFSPNDKVTSNAADGEGNGNPLSVLAWRIPGTGEPGRLSMGSHSVRHD